jgi:hypothetical protein
MLTYAKYAADFRSATSLKIALVMQFYGRGNYNKKVCQFLLTDFFVYSVIIR